MHSYKSCLTNLSNEIKTASKNITSIQYNSLNLPSKVTFKDGSTITYLYAADGTKLRTVHKTGSTATTTDYCGNVVYENGSQKYLLTEEGYVTLADNKYHYYLKDHQGNNRVVISSTGTVEETNHYYPFGEVFAATNNVQPYKYNGKEFDNKNGLNWYDYGARHYDAALGRFVSVDPLAEEYSSTSPYGYCLNDPIRFVDPDGKKIRIGTFWQRLGVALGMKIEFIEKVSEQFEQNNELNSTVKSVYAELENSDLVFDVLPLSESPKGTKIGNHVIPDEKIVPGESQGATLYYDPDMKERPDGVVRDPKIGLAHEMGHLKDLMDGKAVSSDVKKVIQGDKVEKTKMEQNERTSLMLENKIREALGYEKREKYFENIDN